MPDRESYADLFEWLSQKPEIAMDECIAYPGFNLMRKKDKKIIAQYRWNYVEDKVYPCCKTKAKIVERLNKVGIDNTLQTDALIENLWQIFYSVTKKSDLQHALKTFFGKHFNGTNADDFVSAFSRFPAFEKDYGSYSAKAIKKLLPLMRMGKYWNAIPSILRQKRGYKKSLMANTMRI